MKKLLLFVCAVCMVFLCFQGLAATEPPVRRATTVEDTFTANTVDWLIAPGEEAEGDIDPGTPGECDIKGILASQDDRYLRFDIILSGPVTNEEILYYGISCKRPDRVDEYNYCPVFDSLDRDTFIAGEMKSVTYKKGDTKHLAGLTGDKKTVYLFLDKGEFAGAKTGEMQHFSAIFFCDLLHAEAGDVRTAVADETPEVILEFDW